MPHIIMQKPRRVWLVGVAVSSSPTAGTWAVREGRDEAGQFHMALLYRFTEWQLSMGCRAVLGPTGVQKESSMVASML